MKKFFKPLALILALTIIFQMLVFSTAAEMKSGYCGTNATYSLDTQTGVLNLGGTGATENYEKFDEEGWSPVWRPGSSGSTSMTKLVPWQKNAEDVSTVIVGEGITKIGNNAFSQCYNVKTIVFFSQNTQLSSTAFETSKSTYTVYLYEGSAADSYFSNSKHTKIYLNDSSSNASDFEYSINPDGTSATITMYNGNRTAIAIPSVINGYTVSAVEAYAFGWSSATTVTIPESITAIADRAFSDCSNLTTVIFKTKDASIGSSAFYSCSNLNTVFLYRDSTADSYFSDSNYTKIYFSEKYTVTYDANGGIDTPAPQIKTENINLTLTESVPTLEGYTFLGWSTSKDGNVEYYSGDIYSENADITLYAVWTDKVPETYAIIYFGNGGSNIPASQTKTEDIGIILAEDVPTREGYNFLGWSTSINGDVEYVPGEYYNENASLLLYAVWEKIPNDPSVTVDYEYEKNYEDLTVTITKYLGEAEDVVIPSEIDGFTVTAIGLQAFNGCDSIISLVIPDSVTVIGSWSFAYCTNLSSVSLGNNLATIGYRSFENCTSLKNITVPASVSTIGSEPFFNCTSIEKIEVDESNEYYCDLEGVLFTKDMDTIISYPAASNNSEYVIPDSVKNIGASAFYKAENLTDITIPDSVESIESFAFFGCKKLESIEIPGNIKTIERSVFSSCSALTSIVIPSGITSIGARAFSNCSALTDITVPESVTSIEADSFADCFALETIYLYRGSTADEYFSADEYTKVYLDDETEISAGDTNGDGNIDIKDIVLFAQYLADWDVVIDEITADCNGDGTVDMKDIVLLAQYLAGWNVTLG